MKKLKFTVLLAVLMAVGGGKSYAHDIEAANADGVTIYYNFINSQTELEVTYQEGSIYFNADKVVIPESVTYEGKTYFVTSIGENAFLICSGLTEVTIPNSVTSIGDWAFSGCSSLTELTIPNNVTSIGNGAFSDCSSLTELTIPNSVTSIGFFTFRGCSGLTEVTIPNSVIYIGNWAFRYCSGLTEVTIPNSVTSIGYCPFSGCSGLEKITVESGNPKYDSRENCNAIIETNSNVLISGCKNTIIPGSVTAIGDYAFDDCSGLTEVAIPNSVTSIGNYAFYGSSGLEKITVESGNPNYDSRENCNAIIETNSNVLISGCKNTNIPGSVTAIGKNAFYGCRGLTEVTIPNSVTYIGESAFYGCTGLTEVTIPNSVTSIGKNAFDSCIGLTEVTIPNSVTSIGESAFGSCTGLTEVAIPNSVDSISRGTFLNCTGLTKVTIPNSVTYIGVLAFRSCTGLTELTIPSSVISIGDAAFEFCYGLTELTIPGSVTYIGNAAFDGCRGLTEVTIGNCVTYIGGHAFGGCDGLTTLYFLNTTPPTADTSTFNSNHYTDVDLFVPQEALEVYQSADVWKEFQKLQGIEGLGGETEKCATPTIHYANNKLTFKCETEGVTYESTITDTDIASYNNDEIDLSVTYTVTVYATKEGYEDSDVATATLCWIDVEPKTEGITDDDDTAVQQISATPVLIQSANGQITVTGLTDGTPVAVYDLSGQQVGTATSTGGQATVSTSLTTGTAAIVKMGDNKSVKVAVK